MSGDITVGNRLFVTNDASFNGKVFINSDLSMNGNLKIGKDLTVNGNLSVKQYSTNLTVYTVAYNNFTVAEDMSLNGRLYLTGDASMNGQLYVGGDVSFNRNGYIAGNLGAGLSYTNNATTYTNKISTLDDFANNQTSAYYAKNILASIRYVEFYYKI